MESQQATGSPSSKLSNSGWHQNNRQQTESAVSQTHMLSSAAAALQQCPKVAAADVAGRLGFHFWTSSAAAEA